MTLRTPRPISLPIPRLPRELLAVRALVPLTLLSFVAAPVPAARAQEQLWLRQFGTPYADFAYALASDSAGGVMVAGITQGSLGGPNAGGRDAFLARYDSEGNRLWIRQFGTSASEGAGALAPDGAGGVFVAGWTRGDLGGPSAGESDIFLARYDSEGDRLWIRQFGTSSTDGANALAPDGAGGVMVAGFTHGSLGGPRAGGMDAWIARYDGAGNRLWIRQFGTSGDERASALAPDGAGGVMVAGRTIGSLGGPWAGGNDAFLARYDGAGNRLWLRQFGTSESDVASALAPDGAGGVMVAGRTHGSLGGPNAGFRDAFLARYDSEGDRVWIRQFGTSNFEMANALAPDAAGGVLVAGWTDGSLGGPDAGEQDVCLARYTIGVCPCACDFDTSTGSGVCDLVDFVTFAGLFAAADPCACDMDTSTGPGVCDIVDFTTFAGQFAAGCP